MHNQILWLKLKFSSIFFLLNSNQAEHEKRKVDRTKSWNLLSCHFYFYFFLLLKYIRIKIIYRNSNFLSFFLFSPQPNPIKPRSLVFSVLMSLKWPTTKKTKNKSKSNYPTQIQFFFLSVPFLSNQTEQEKNRPKIELRIPWLFSSFELLNHKTIKERSNFYSNPNFLLFSPIFSTTKQTTYLIRYINLGDKEELETVPLDTEASVWGKSEESRKDHKTASFERRWRRRQEIETQQRSL